MTVNSKLVANNTVDITGNTTILGNIVLNGVLNSTTINTKLIANNTVNILGNTTISGKLNINNATDIVGNTSITGNLKVNATQSISLSAGSVGGEVSLVGSYITIGISPFGVPIPNLIQIGNPLSAISFQSINPIGVNNAFNQF